MKVIHIESGLGNQMLSYCEYLAMKKMNPDEDIYIETIIYDIPECNEVTCQWNGYELNRIFGISTPANIRTLFTEEQWNQIITEIRRTEFWKENMNYPVHFTNAFRNAGLELVNTKGDFSEKRFMTGKETDMLSLIKRKLVNTYLGNFCKRMNNKWHEEEYIRRHDYRNRIFINSNKNLFSGQWLGLKFRENNRDLIDEEIREVFHFPDFSDTKNREMAAILKSCNAIAIHARRGDMLSSNGWCYKFGYFQRAVKHIRKHVKNPVFVFFTNPGSIEWCRENEKIFGLDFKTDTVKFVDWNTGIESYRDMQLMGLCKHAIITNSSFGWWGAYFITNPRKITISPCIEIDTTYHC
ncbi:alpha-1,2-fucosyltransferase [Bacteroides fluxus]|jgi:hypothetical protein|uniref:alpha-1,2-fucosyltransferase n=1 Tax=Bacteroides fluxus TaxID=626930 RepID=UPI0023527B22|nr:alpha-1,2-fucosyltransferase [Bacteroides fluxus]